MISLLLLFSICSVMVYSFISLGATSFICSGFSCVIYYSVNSSFNLCKSIQLVFHGLVVCLPAYLATFLLTMSSLFVLEIHAHIYVVKN